MRALLVGIAFMCCALSIQAQLPYTEAKYTYNSTLNLTYGNAIDYAGNTVALTMDLYKPNNDFCNRPIMILVHGGAWVAGTKNDVDLVAMSKFFAQRGYVVANINYRLGNHKTNNFTKYAFCSESLASPCAYVADSAEVIRANYRGMQDLKGVIRYMKLRHGMDSSDHNNVFLAGESAGGFICLSAAFVNDGSEVHASCNNIADAVVADPDMANYNCLATPLNRTRPDLGNLEGTIYSSSSYDSRVQGVGNFFGGSFDLSQIDSTEAINTALYLYHQGSDVVVHYNKGPLLGRISWECFAQTNLCQSFSYYPWANGSKAIHQHISKWPVDSRFYKADIIENYQYMQDCTDNGHSIDNGNINTRVQTMANVFAEKIKANGNSPKSDCQLSIQNIQIQMHLSPNPNQGQFTLSGPYDLQGQTFEIHNNLGQMVYSGKVEEGNSFRLKGLNNGCYALHIGNYNYNFIINY